MAIRAGSNTDRGVDSQSRAPEDRGSSALASMHTSLWLCLLLGVMAVSAQQANDLECSHLMDTYLQTHHREAQTFTDQSSQMVYFLHVPRTAGRTFHACFLKLGTQPKNRCPKAYDHLRLNMSVPNCHLLSSHDDFSVVSMLPDNVAVLTHLRDPVDRFLSAYEFAVEVGSRSLTRPANFRKRPDKIATEDVWPWSYLVPWFGADISARMAKVRQVPQPEQGHWILVQHPDGDEFYYNKVLHLSKWNLTEEERVTLLPPLNPYDNDMVMSLEEFTQHPIAKELLHNGQTFQVLGITNYSHWGDSGAMRRCYWDGHSSQGHLDDVAVARVQRFMHVGVTDRLSHSVEAASVAMHFTLSGPAFGGGDELNAATFSKGGTTKSIGEEQAEIEKAAKDKNAVKKSVGAADLPDLAVSVREARTQLQSAQRELFQASQASTANVDELIKLKGVVALLRRNLREVQDSLGEARSKLPTAIKAGSTPHTGGTLTDEEFAKRQLAWERKLPSPLGEEYLKCATRAQDRNLQRRNTSLQTIAMPDGRWVIYSKEARKLIPASVMEQIRQLNQGDAALHKLGTGILNHNRETWKTEGKLQDLPPVTEVRPTPSKKKFSIPKPRDREIEEHEL